MNVKLSEIQRPYQICSRCIMDTSDPQISFNDKGYCNHCVIVEEVYLNKTWFPLNGHSRLTSILEQIRKDGRKNTYDCIIGLSGGVDSSYLAYLVVKEFGLRPLAIHVDAGWNSEIAVHNIEKIVRKLNIDLYTEVIDWEEVQDLQRAYIRAGVANQDVPQDHAFFTVLYKKTKSDNIRYFLSGGNFATESILPRSWGHSAMDARNLKAIHKVFGERSLKHYPMLSLYENYLYYPYISKLKNIRPLNYISYNREEAILVLQRELDWCNYGDKHHESRWTKWFQSYYLPTRFGYDKRRAHLSSMIMSNQITRENALAHLITPSYDENERRIDEEFIIKKLDIDAQEFSECFQKKPRHYSEFANLDIFYKLKDKAKKHLPFLRRV
ncbi:MAG: N-acetyl sugar amidotransferase [Alphaproteobacteria bacterium]|nr:N-acetyl sugar amidotransferase [Alphaproteobacteria bacterium]